MGLVIGVRCLSDFFAERMVVRPRWSFQIVFCFDAGLLFWVVYGFRSAAVVSTSFGFCFAVALKQNLEYKWFDVFHLFLFFCKNKSVGMDMEV